MKKMCTLTKMKEKLRQEYIQFIFDIVKDETYYPLLMLLRCNTTDMVLSIKKISKDGIVLNLYPDEVINLYSLTFNQAESVAVDIEYCIKHESFKK